MIKLVLHFFVFRLQFYEATMNVLIDILRQSPDEKKLKSNYEQATDLLDEMAKMYGIFSISFPAGLKNILTTIRSAIIFETKDFNVSSSALSCHIN